MGGLETNGSVLLLLLRHTATGYPTKVRAEQGSPPIWPPSARSGQSEAQSPNPICCENGEMSADANPSQLTVSKSC